MTRTTDKSDRITGADKDLARAIVLALVNDGNAQTQVEYLRRRQAIRAKKGEYDPRLAARSWRYTVERYLPTYRKYDGDVGQVDVPTRNLAGRLLEQDQREYVYAAAGVAEPAFPEADAELEG